MSLSIEMIRALLKFFWPLLLMVLGYQMYRRAKRDAIPDDVEAED